MSEVEPSRGLQNAVTDLFRFKPARRMTPDKSMRFCP